MKEVLNFILEHPGITIVGAFTLVQIAPIKINPWGWIAKVIKKWLIGDLEKEVKDLKADFTEERVEQMRWTVLEFASSCGQGLKHRKDQWDKCLELLGRYEDYCQKNDIPNGVMDQTASYLKNKYQGHLKNNDFLD